MATFDSTKTALSKLLEQVVEGAIQLPGFQRGSIWDDTHIRSVLVSIARSFLGQQTCVTRDSIGAAVVGGGVTRPVLQAILISSGV